VYENYTISNLNASLYIELIVNMQILTAIKHRRLQ